VSTLRAGHARKSLARMASLCVEVIRDSASLSPHVVVAHAVVFGFVIAPIAFNVVQVARVGIFARARRTLAWSLGVVAVVALSACGKKEAPPVALRPVVAMAAVADTHTVQSSLPATIEARYSTPLSFRVGGKIIERRVRLGDSVKAGEIVAKLDPADNAKSAASAAAQLSAAQHQLTYAEQQLTRDRAQAQENLIARAQLEQTENAYAAALAQRNQAQAQAALSADQLKYTTLVADRAGVITAEQADTGQNVSAGQAVYNLAWSGEIDVVADVPETTLGSLAVGQKATVKLAALGGKQFAARVREVSPAADPQSRTYRVRMTLEAPTPEVRLGMTADVAFAQVPASGASGASSQARSRCPPPRFFTRANCPRSGS
jgi:multidrug efflux system membrane fusion protein